MKGHYLLHIMLLMLLALVFVPKSFAQEYVVRQIYFHPSDRNPSQTLISTLDKVMEDVQKFYADEMERHGFGRKTFRLETDAGGEPVIHHIRGKYTNTDYYIDKTARALQEVLAHFQIFNYYSHDQHFIYIIYFDIEDTTAYTHGGVSGSGDGGSHGGVAIIDMVNFDDADTFDDVKDDLYIQLFAVIAHELGHAFGLSHEFRDDQDIMSYGIRRFQDRLSYIAAEWLDVNRYFNMNPSTFDRLPTIEMLSPTFVSPPNTIRLQFRVTHTAKIHQVQLLTNSLRYGDNRVTEIIAYKSIKGYTDIVEFVTDQLLPQHEYVVLTVIDEYGNFPVAETILPIDITTLIPDPEPAVIPDPKLAAAIRDRLGLAPGSPISQLDMLALYNLNTNPSPATSGIADLTGLQHATNLNDLYMWDNQIVDFTPIAGLKRLTYLTIDKSKISDVRPLAGLTQLSSLNLLYNQISDVRPLAGLTRLHGLSLRYNNISDITPLTALTNLIWLRVGENQITDLPSLTDLTALEELYLAFNQVRDVSPLVGLINLRQLTLAGNPIEDFSPLRILLAENPNLDIDIDIPFGFITNFIANQTFVVGSDVSLTLPIAASGTAPYTYRLSPIPAGLSFNTTTRVLSGTPTRAGTTSATYTATDAANVSASLTFTIEVTVGVILDVNGDGQVNVVDLAIVALSYGTQVPVGGSLSADVNTDGVVDILDLTAVAQGIDAANNSLYELSLEEIEAALLAAAEQTADIETIAEAPNALSGGNLTYRNVAAALADARLDKGVPETVLKALLQLLKEIGEMPKASALLPNYPNPFNPETWIPYRLSKPTEVAITIYATNGQVVRQLALGHQPAGIYQSRSRAAYWDGRNAVGEPVASGLYFYTLTAGYFTATRKMLIQK